MVALKSSMFLIDVLFFSGLLVASATTAQSESSQCSFLQGIYTSVMRRIFNQGFHKELSTEVEVMWTTSILPEDCRLVIEETVPRGMYVDTDQLRDLRDSDGLHTYVASKVDVEKPEFESEAFRVLVFRRLVAKENLRITSVMMPVHLRYHKPGPPITALPTSGGLGKKASSTLQGHAQSQSSPVAYVKLQNPRLLLTCEGEDLTLQCPERTVTSYCDWTGTSKCQYLHLPYKINVKNVEVSVPVGNSEHTPYVVGITTFIVSGGTVYLMVALFRTLEPKKDP